MRVDGADHDRFYGSRRAGRAVLGGAIVLIGMAGLAGCSTAPEWARPGLIYGDENAAAATAAPSGIDKFPELAAVPERRSPSTTPEQRAEMLHELMADRARAKRTDQILEKGGSTVAPPLEDKSGEDLSGRNETGKDGSAPHAANATEGALPAPAAGTGFAASSAPDLSPWALEAAGPVVAARYYETRGLSQGLPGGFPETVSTTPVIPQPVPQTAETGPPVTVNLAALDYLPGAPGPTLARAAWGGPDVVNLVEPARMASASGPAAPRAQGSQNSQDIGIEGGQGGPGDIPPYVVLFNHGSAAVTDGDRDILAQAIEAQRDYDGTLRIVGHASGRTSSRVPGREKLINFEMSLKRATAVAEELIRQGADPAKVIVEARGDADLAYIETLPQGEAGNRRAEIFLEFGTIDGSPPSDLLMTGSLDRS